ncbi:MAG TPA: IS256 family transposase [Candidatus Omnitrophota bacterium]|nr:IS256 family transposase [Candidatus Omnitrophota bacterium]
MHNTLNFEGHLTTRWFESKRQFRALFWEDLQMKLRNETKVIIQQMIQTEFNFLIGAEPYQRAPGRKTKRNGSYTRSLETVVGRIEDIRIPRARNLDIRFSLFDRWQQVEDGVLEAMLQTYLLGRSGACAQEIIQSFGHSRFSKTFLQKLTHRVENDLQDWLNRPISKRWPYVFIDGMVVGVREAELQQWCVLWAFGMDEHHNTEILGFVILKSESQEGCERLLNDLKRRGLQTPKLIISDDSKAIENAAAMIFPHTPQQGCMFHKVKAAGQHIKNSKNKKRFLRDASDVYMTATGQRSLLQNLAAFKNKWRRSEPRAVRSFVTGFERTMTYLRFPKDHWRWIYTNNSMESLIDKVRDWTHRYGYFQGRGNLYIALFTFIQHKQKPLAPIEDQSAELPKDTILIA